MAIDRQGISTGKTVRELTEELENELLLNFRKQFVAKRDEPLEGFDWDSWRVAQMRKFNKFKRDNVRLVNKYRRLISKEAVKDLEKSYRFGIRIVDNQIKKAIKQGAKLRPRNKIPIFTKNPRVVKQLDELQQTLNRSYSVGLKSLETQFLLTLQKAQQMDKRHLHSVFQAIDMANKELIRHGITGTITSNNRRINIANQIELTAVETSQEVLFIGEAAKSEDVGIYTVYISKHSSSCPLCTPWQGKVLIDDVYMPGKPDGKHPLLSDAIKAGLFHYHCRHNRITFIPGVDVIPDSEKNALKGMTKQQQHALYEAEQELRKNERAIRKWKREQAMSLSQPEYEKAHRKVLEYQKRNRELVKHTDGLYRNYWREKPGFTVPKDVRWQNLKYDKHIFDN